MPATCCASPPSMIVAAAGVGASGDVVNGKPHAGVLFHRSDTGRVVVESHADDPLRNFGVRRRILVRRANVGVVDVAVTTERAVGLGREVVVRPLIEHANVIVDLGCEEQAPAGEHDAVLALHHRNRVAGIGICRAVVVEMADRRLRHDGHRRVRLALFSRPEGPTDRVARRLEKSAVRRELGPAHMAGRALLPGLTRKGGDRVGPACSAETSTSVRRIWIRAPPRYGHS